MGVFFPKPRERTFSPAAAANHLNYYHNYEDETNFLGADELAHFGEEKAAKEPITTTTTKNSIRPKQRIICTGHGKDIVENNLIVTSETFTQTLMWLINYLIVARVARELHNSHEGMGYISALSICLFIFVFATSLMKRSSDQMMYFGFLLFILVCIYFK